VKEENMSNNERDTVIDPIDEEYEQWGLLPEQPGMMQTYMPRIRPPEDSLIRPWQINTFPIRRQTVRQLPGKWDWRNVENSQWITPVRDQGECGSCAAFAVTAAVESHIMIEKNDTNLRLDLSEASLFFAAHRQCCQGEPQYGWYISGALYYLVKEGICFEENYPYRPENQPAELIKGAERTYRISGFDSTTKPSQMKRWLVEEGPLAAGFSVYDDFRVFWNGGANGVYKHSQGIYKGSHAVLVVGYDDNESCWICKNSKKPRSGSDGFFRIGYEQCGIDSRMYLIEDVYEIPLRNEYRYDPNSLRVVPFGEKGWLLTDGGVWLKLLDNKEDARNALRVARRHTIRGLIGRYNGRKNYLDYINEYWIGDSGLPHEPLTRSESIPYDPNNVTAKDKDQEGWSLADGRSLLAKADNKDDALAALRLIQRHNRKCFIGRGNRRPNPQHYIMTYWE
jgi:C1A family cysteine protease